MGIQYDIRQPCAGCPFRATALKGWLGQYSPHEVIDTIRNEAPFLCHVHIENTTGYHGDDWLERAIDAGTAQHCAGALIFAKKMCKIPRDPVHAAAVRSIEPVEILWPPTVFLIHHEIRENESRMSHQPDPDS